MSSFHRCRTCGTRYPCNLKWCPGCGKRLGHRDARGADTAMTDESRYTAELVYRCSTCGDVTIDVYAPRYCGNCGARVVEEVVGDGKD